jgi:hypothetical protein
LPLVLKIIKSKNIDIDAFILAILLKNLNTQKTKFEPVRHLADKFQSSKIKFKRGLSTAILKLFGIWKLPFEIYL